MHVDGIPFRKLGDQLKLSGKQIFLKIKATINLLIWNWQLTRMYATLKDSPVF